MRFIGKLYVFVWLQLQRYYIPSTILDRSMKTILRWKEQHTHPVVNNNTKKEQKISFSRNNH